jgi:hypothetical protein
MEVPHPDQAPHEAALNAYPGRTKSVERAISFAGGAVPGVCDWLSWVISSIMSLGDWIGRQAIGIEN